MRKLHPHAHKVKSRSAYTLYKSKKPVLNQPIHAGTGYANHLGFTQNRFTGYLWDSGNGAIIISLITVKYPGRGHFSKLIKDIEAKGKTVAIPSPLGQMQAILLHWGFIKTIDPSTGAEVWTRRAAV